MQDFKSYSNQPHEQPKAHQPEKPEINGTVEMAKLLAQTMNGKSQGQILQTILSEAERGKRDGTLTNADLDAFYNALAPMLDGIKKRKLKEVIMKLKAI